MPDAVFFPRMVLFAENNVTCNVFPLSSSCFLFLDTPGPFLHIRNKTVFSSSFVVEREGYPSCRDY